MSTTQQPEALRRASLLKLSGVLPGSVAMEVADDAIRLHAELETLRAGYAAARLEIESLRARVGEAPAGEYPALPNPVGWRDKNMHCDLYWKPSQLALVDFEPLFTEAQMRAYVDTDRAMRAAHPAGAQQPGTAYAELPYKQALGSTNCMQCCVSYMMGLPLENVPDFATDGGWERFSDFAETQGYVAVMLPGNREYEADYLASGTTARGTSHMVVMNDGKLVHDPHPSNAGLVDVQCVWLLAKRASPTQGQQDEHTAFEASAKTYTSNVSFERDASDYVDMTASLLWHGWKLRTSHGQAPAQPAPTAPLLPSGWSFDVKRSDGRVWLTISTPHGASATLSAAEKTGNGDDTIVARVLGYLADSLAAQPAPQQEASPTAGMNIAQRILHVGGRNNAAGYVEFGSIQAVEALVRQVLRDLPSPPQPAPQQEPIKKGGEA